MDHRLGRSPSPALSHGRDGKPLAHTKHHSRPSSRSSSRASSRPSSRGSPYTQNQMLLSALHQGQSPQPPSFAGLALPHVPLQHRISPLPLSAFPPSMPIFQGPGLVNILPNSGPGMALPGSFSPELLGTRGSSASSVSPGSQSSMSPLSALRPSPLHPQFAPELMRLPPVPDPSAAMALQIANQRQDLASMAAQQQQQHKHDIPYCRADVISSQEYSHPSQPLRQNMPPPPNRDVRHDILHRELIGHELSRGREPVHPVAKRDSGVARQPLNEVRTYPSTGALAQLIKMNNTQAGGRVLAPPETSVALSRSAVVIQGPVSSENVLHQGVRTGGGKPVPSSQQHAHVGAFASVPTSFVVPNSVISGKQTTSFPVSSSSVITSVHNPHSVAKPPHTSVVTLQYSTSAGPRLHSNAVVTTLQSSITMTTTVHSGSIQSVPAFSQGSTRQKAPLKPIIAQKPTSLSQPVRVVKINTGKPAFFGSNGPAHDNTLLNKIKTAQPTVTTKPGTEAVRPGVQHPLVATVVKVTASGSEASPRPAPVRTLSPHAVAKLQEALSNGCSPRAKAKVKDEELPKQHNPLNMRVLTLANFPSTQQTFRVNYRSHAMAVHRARAGSITNAAKSLDLLRQNLQKFINKEIDDVVQKYVESYFKPAMLNIKENSGEDSPALDDYLTGICGQVLEEAKKMYMAEVRSVTPEVADNVSEAGSVGSSRPSSRATLTENKDIRAVKHSLFNIKKRRGSSDSDASMSKKRVRKQKQWPGVSGRVTPVKKQGGEMVRKEGPKWDPERLNTDLQFVMGSRANKALGLGNMRGRLYVKHPDLFKYIGDQEDKQWLNENKHMPSSGGKAYLLVVQDILDLAHSEEYKDASLQLHEIVGFCVPHWMIEKMRKQMGLQRMVKNKPALAPVNHAASSPLSSHLQNSDDEDARDVERLPFTSMYSDSPHKTDSDLPPASPATTDNCDNLSFDEDDASEVSPLQMTGGFVGGASSRGSSPLLRQVDADVQVTASTRLGLPAYT